MNNIIFDYIVCVILGIIITILCQIIYNKYQEKKAEERINITYKVFYDGKCFNSLVEMTEYIADKELKNEDK